MAGICNIRIKVVRFSQVRIGAAELGLRRVSTANLPPEAINSVLTQLRGCAGDQRVKNEQQYIDTLLLNESPLSPAHSKSMSRHT